MALTTLPSGHVVSGTDFQAVTDEINARGIKARARRITTSSTTTTIVGVLRLDGVAVTSGRSYRIWTSDLNLISNTNGDDPQAVIRFTTDGSTATTASALLPGAAARGRYVASTGSVYAPIVAPYYPGANQTLSLLLCVTRSGGAGAVSIFGDANNSIDLVVEDMGPAPADTGVSI